jgi:hypothetical protein
VVKVFDTGMPIWGVFFAIAMCLVLQIPIGIISAVSNVEIGLNVIAEFIGGLVTPGNPLAMMIFKYVSSLCSEHLLIQTELMAILRHLKVSRSRQTSKLATT